MKMYNLILVIFLLTESDVFSQEAVVIDTVYDYTLYKKELNKANKIMQLISKKELDKVAEMYDGLFSHDVLLEYLKWVNTLVDKYGIPTNEGLKVTTTKGSFPKLNDTPKYQFKTTDIYYIFPSTSEGIKNMIGIAIGEENIEFYFSKEEETYSIKKSIEELPAPAPIKLKQD